ncbi:odorant receptor 4-like isoform X2 [Ceratina calcarata]|uniref:Odorant receptor n=1 Tax=Ceratina calcarata TaxID=156304 RepID=A0AAJ7WB04_9HYME|nr:odorant receptor 4-like isoform X2 [Ceratina calcarata]
MHLIAQDQTSYNPGNKNYKQDIVFVTKHIKWILSLIGIWPSVSKGVAKFLPKIAIGIGNFALLFAIIPCFLHTVFEVEDTVMKLKLLGLVGFCTSSLLKYWALVARKPTIEDCIELVQIDWMQDRELMLKYGQVGRNLTILCVTFMYTGGTIFHTVLQYTIGTFIDQHNRTIKPLVYPTYSVLYDVQTSPIYEIVYIIHFMCGHVTSTVAAGSCGLAALFVTHACGQIDVVVSHLTDLVHSEQNEKTSILNRRFVQIIDHHLRILRFSAAVDFILREICLVELVNSTCCICLLEYYCIADWEQSNTTSLITYMMLLISLTFNVLILCYIGDLLIEKTSSVGQSCFMIDWYNLPSKTIQGLVLIIAMSGSPVKISAGSIVDLSLSTFANILKTSVAYLNFLRTTVT